MSSVDESMAGMGTQMQSETYFLRHCPRNLSRGISTAQWLSYNKGKVKGNSQHEDSSSPWPGLMVRYSGHDKENFKEIILEHEVTFRHQVRELHRLYRRQRDLMNAIPNKRLYEFQKKTESPQSVIFSSMSSECAKRTADESPLLSSDSIIRRLDPSRNVQSTGRKYLGSLNEPFRFLSSSCQLSCHANKLERHVLAANASSCCFLHKQSSQYSMPEMNDLSLHIVHKTEIRKKRKIFGVEIGEEVDESSLVSSHTKSSYPKSNGAESGASPFLSAGASASCLSKKVTSPQGSHGATTSELSWLKLGSCLQNLEFVEGTDAHDALKCSVAKSELIPELKVGGAATSLDVLKGENDFTSPPDLFGFHDSSNCWQNVTSKQLKSRKIVEFPENVSQHLFKISEKAEISSKEFKSEKSIEDVTDHPTDSVDRKSPTRLVANSNSPKKSLSNNITGFRNPIDLNVSVVEEESPEAAVLPADIVKIIRPEIDLEVAAVEFEVEHGVTKSLDESEKPHQYLIEEAAEALVVISLGFTDDVARLENTSSCLHWFADVIGSHTNDEDGEIREISQGINECCNEEAVRDGMDYFEFMTLQLKGVKEEINCYSLSDMEHQKAEETERFGRTMRRRGRQRKDFQKDVLPNLISLAKQEVVEDLHTLEEIFHSTGKTWKSSLSRRNGAKNGSRGMNSRESLHTTETNLALPSKQKKTCRELQLRGKSFTSWGKRTRRLPRRRCSKKLCSAIQLLTSA